MKSIISICLPAVFLLWGCIGPGNGDTQVELARVGNKVLTLEKAREKIPMFIYQQDSTTAIRNFRDDWIRKQLILQESNRLQLSETAEVRERLREMREDVLKQALKDYVLAEFEQDLEITDEEARNYYQANKNQFVLNERFVRFRHVATSGIKEARAAKRDLMRGIEWPEVARRYSLNPEAAVQHSQKFWPMSMAVSDITIMNDLLERIGITEISPIHRVGNNYHFVQLMETRPEGGHPDLDWLMDQIKDWLKLEKRRRRFNSYVKNLYLKAESNNEIESYNVYPTNRNTNEVRQDTTLSSQNQ